MTTINQNLFGSLKAATDVWLYLTRQIDLLEITKKRILKEKDEPWPTIHPLVFAVIDSSKSVLTLSQDWRVRDCYVIARTIYETIINICFICAKGKEAAKRMKDHHLQKVYREAERELKIGEAGLKVKWDGEVDLEKHTKLKAAIDAFTRDKNKKEIRQWTPENLDKRLDAINAKYGEEITTDLLFAHISIYRHASEIIHGTYFGAVFAAGYSSLPGPPRSEEEFKIFQQKQVSLLLMMIGASVVALFNVVSKEIDIDEIVKESKEATIKLGKVLKWESHEKSNAGFTMNVNKSQATKKDNSNK